MAGIAHGYTNLNSGQVEMTGSAIQLPDYPASEVVITALKANIDPVYLGPTGVTDTTGLELAPGASVTINIGRTSMLWAIGNSGDKISFAAAY